MASSTHALRIELYDSPDTINGGHLRARLLLDGVQLKTESILTSSTWSKLSDDLQWYLEEYIYSDAFATERASLVERDLRNVCRRVAVDLELEQALSHAPLISLGHVELQIVNKAEALYDLVFAFPWELLEHTEMWSATSKSITVSRLIARTSRGDCVRNHEDGAPVNILLASARASDTLEGRMRDIFPFVALEAITRLQDRLVDSTHMTVEVARPGTWPSVKQRLASHPPGYYSLVHFDVHGGNRAGAPSLSFADPSGSGHLKKEFVATVARALQRAEVQSVVLNACGSASHTHGSDANPAHIFLQHGITSVVGMSHRASAAAMSIFLESFYERLFTSSSFATATAVGRRALSNLRSRQTNQQVDRDLCDYILPVFYTSDILSASLSVSEHVFEDPPDSVPTARSYYLHGRDFDILRLERSLSENDTVCLVGGIGVGKSVLLHRAAEVWEKTGLFTSCHYFDLKYQRQSGLEEFWQSTQFGIEAARPLVIIDNIEDAVALNGVERSRRLMRADWVHMQTSVANHTGIKYILAARTRALFSPNILEIAQVCELGGLNPIDSLALLRRELGISAGQWSGDDRLSAGLLLEMLQHNPVAVHLLIPWMNATRLGIHNFFEALIDWKIESETSPYWNALANEQLKFPGLADMTRCFLQLDRAGQYTWLWLSLYWNHGSQVSTTTATMANFAFEVPNGTTSVVQALDLGEEHGFFAISGEPRFVTNINPLFTIWIRYGLFHGLRVLRHNPAEYNGGMMHAFMATGNLRTLLGVGNPLRIEFSDPFDFARPKEMKDSLKSGLGSLKSFWTSDFSDALLSIKNSSDKQSNALRIRQLRFNYLSAFNTLMGSQEVLDLRRMQFMELQLYWMMARDICEPHETAMQSRRIVALMEYTTCKIDVSGLEDFRVASALDLLSVPVLKARCTLEGTTAVHENMVQLGKRIWAACKARSTDQSSPMLAARGAVLKMVSADPDTDEFRNMSKGLESSSKILDETLEHMVQAMPALAGQLEQMRSWWTRFSERANDNTSMDEIRDAYDDLGRLQPIGLDNPFNALCQAHNNEDDVSNRTAHLADALHDDDSVRAVRLLKLMISDAHKVYEWDKARHYLEIFWKLKGEHPSISKSDVEYFADLDALTTLQWELEQWSLNDGPGQALKAAVINMKNVHSVFRPNSSGNVPEEQAGVMKCLDYILPIVEGLDPGMGQDRKSLADTVKTFRALSELKGIDPEAQKSIQAHLPTAALLEQHQSDWDEAHRLCNAGDPEGARRKLRRSIDCLANLDSNLEITIPFHFRHMDVPRRVNTRVTHFNRLVRFGVIAFSQGAQRILDQKRLDYHDLRNSCQSALETFLEAQQLAAELGALSLSEQPAGWQASARQAQSLSLETELLIKAIDGDLIGAARLSRQLFTLLIVLDSRLPAIPSKKIEWYRYATVRLTVFHHAREWHRLTKSFKPHQAALHLKRIANHISHLDYDSRLDESLQFMQNGICMAWQTCKQLVLIRGLGPAAGRTVWEQCCTSYEFIPDFMFGGFEPLTVFYFESIVEFLAEDID